MAYFALPIRDSTIHRLANAAPGLPRRSCTGPTSSHLNLEAPFTKSVRLHSLNFATDHRRLGSRSLSNYVVSRRIISASVEGNVAVEEPATEVATGETTSPEEGATETVPPADNAETESAIAKTLQRKTTMRRTTGGAKTARSITVQKEQLLPGAVFTGTVRAVQSYGAFVDIGAFTDGLVHISELSATYIKAVQDIVSVGQEISVRVIELDEKAGRIGLTMRDKESEDTQRQAEEQNEERTSGAESQNGDGGKVQNRGKIAGRGGPSTRGRRDDNKKVTKLTKGQELKGTVKNIIRNGAFLELPEGEEGFLRGSEITEGGENVAMETLLAVGQEVTVRVLRIERGKVNLTMKAQVDMKSINNSINKNDDGVAANPFEVFFRNSNLISGATEETPTVGDESAKEDVPVTESAQNEIPSVEEEASEGKSVAIEQPTAELDETGIAQEEVLSLEESKPEAGGVQEETPAQKIKDSVVQETLTTEEAALDQSKVDDVQAEPPAQERTQEVTTGETKSDEVDASVPEEEVAKELVEAIQDIEKTATEAAEDVTTENQIEDAVDKKVEEEPAPITDEVPTFEDSTPQHVEEGANVPEASAVPVEEAQVLEQVPKSDTETSVPDLEESASERESSETSPTIPQAFAAETDSLVDLAPTEASKSASDETPQQTPESISTVADEISTKTAVPEVPTTESTTSMEPEISTPAEVVAETPAQQSKEASSGPTAAQVKELREITGAGMMECKRALLACHCDITNAVDYLRKKGLASAEKKASRIAAEGLVGSYVHDGRIGVLIEVNCETDFVSRGDQFKELVADMGMQVVACPLVQVVSAEDIPADVVAKEKDIESGKEDLAKKPPQIREKIVEGRVQKRLAELSLLEQAYIRDDKLLVKDVVKQTIATLGEKVQVRRFVRFNLGEGIQKKSVDFAAEVAAQTTAKADVKPKTEAPKVEEPKQEDNTPKVAVSAASVKELRDATGAGMMDCKKALASCENNVEKATEYLRKKGLASAEKKASRVASEGLIGSYIHDGRIGVLIEINSETDFVARSDAFKELVTDMGMQVAACPQVQYVTVDEIPAEFIEKEKEVESGKEDLAKKPEAMRSKIVEGRVAKRMNELVLLEQPYIRDDKILVRDIIKQTVATLGENIQVRRFARFNIGEGIEKRSTDFAAEVAAQTGGRV